MSGTLFIYCWFGSLFNFLEVDIGYVVITAGMGSLTCTGLACTGLCVLSLLLGIENVLLSFAECLLDVVDGRFDCSNILRLVSIL